MKKNIELKGCEPYTLYQDVTDPNTFLLYEEWQDLNSFNAYKDSPAFGETMAVLVTLMAGKPNSAYYESVLIRP